MVNWSHLQNSYGIAQTLRAKKRTTYRDEMKGQGKGTEKQKYNHQISQNFHQTQFMRWQNTNKSCNPLLPFLQTATLKRLLGTGTRPFPTLKLLVTFLCLSGVFLCRYQHPCWHKSLMRYSSTLGTQKGLSLMTFRAYHIVRKKK